jgi:hypothetical protein
MTFHNYGFSPRNFLILFLFFTLSSAASAQKTQANGFNPAGTSELFVDDFDNQVYSQQLWELGGGSWTDHFIPDGSGGYALNFFDEDDKGGGQDGNPNAGATLPPPDQSGGYDTIYYPEGYFFFDMALYANPVLGKSPRMRIFSLFGPRLHVEMKYEFGAWHFQLQDGVDPASDWIELPAGITACRVEIRFVAGDPTQTGIFEVRMHDPSGSHGWALAATHSFPVFGEWHALFLGMRTPEIESFVPPPLSNNYDSSWLTSIAYDNFFAYSEEPASWSGF